MLYSLQPDQSILGIEGHTIKLCHHKSSISNCFITRPEWEAIGLPDIMTLSTPFKMIYLQDFEFSKSC